MKGCFASFILEKKRFLLFLTNGISVIEQEVIRVLVLGSGVVASCNINVACRGPIPSTQY